MATVGVYMATHVAHAMRQAKRHKEAYLKERIRMMAVDDDDDDGGGGDGGGGAADSVAAAPTSAPTRKGP